MTQLSIVIPVFNEKENISPLLAEIRAALKSLNRPYECVFVDDGSTDGSVEEIKREMSLDKSIRLVVFRRNFGQTAAIAAGFEHAKGDVIVTMDADLQNDPKDIPRLLAKIEEGYDLVSGWRKDRKDPFIRIFPSNVANKIIAKVTGVPLHDSGCTLKAYRRSVIEELNLYGQMHRFIPAIASWAGVSLIEIPVTHHPRTRGLSKYGISRTFRVMLDLITVKFFLSYSTSPIQIFGKIGFFSAFTGIACFVAALFLKVTQGRTLTGDPLFYLFIFFEMTGVQFILIGLLGEINIRTYHESRNKKTYVIKEVF